MVTAAALTLVLANPVGGEVAAGFDVGANPFAGGQHRGVDLTASAGEEVKAACGGRVVVAGRVGSSGRLVTVSCDGWRVTHMPMATVAVRAGAQIRSGTALGTVGRSADHAGLHLGVRREGSRFGYVDPLQFLAGPGALPPPAVAPRRLHRLRPRWPSVDRRSPHPLSERPRVVPEVQTRGTLAPWPAWAGLALVLAGAGLRWRHPAAASLRRPRWRSTSPPRSTT
ncbi:MAG: murein hydrolase activator EnvC family protein [Solirubrobacteraceae bacterium]